MVEQSSEKNFKMEWQQYQQEIERLKLKVIDLAKSKLSGGSAAQWVTEKIIFFFNQATLRQPHPERYVAMQTLIGGTPNIKTAPEIDLPEPYNVKQFLEQFLLEIQKLPNKNS